MASNLSVSSVALDLFGARERRVHERLLGVVTDLDDERIAWRPAPKAHSIGYAPWHCARVDDNVQSDLIGGPLLWERGGYVKGLLGLRGSATN